MLSVSEMVPWTLGDPLLILLTGAVGGGPVGGEAVIKVCAVIVHVVLVCLCSLLVDVLTRQETRVVVMHQVTQNTAIRERHCEVLHLRDK